jgi:KipI family sensor histidine kinase inhibitor
MSVPPFQLLPAGDTALLVELGESIDRRVSALVLALAQRLRDARLDGLIETVPTFRSLLVHYDPLVLSAAALSRHIAELMPSLEGASQAGRLWHLPACYDRELAPDLDEVAKRTGLTAAQVIDRHSAVTYHVYMLGFLPGQAYLGDLPPELRLDRRESPRPKIPAGSLAIATGMTCVFPLETPCGWHLVGRCPVPLWQKGPQPSALLSSGDQVIFTPVSLCEYERLRAKAAQGTLRLAPVECAIGAAA